MPYATRRASGVRLCCFTAAPLATTTAAAPSHTPCHKKSNKLQFTCISWKKLLLIIFILVRLRANFLLTEALPADTVPPFLKMAGSFAKPSRVVCGLGCSSTSKLCGPENSNHQQETSVNFILNHNRQMNYRIYAYWKWKEWKKSHIYIYVKHLKINKFSEFIQLIT